MNAVAILRPECGYSVPGVFSVVQWAPPSTVRCSPPRTVAYPTPASAKTISGAIGAACA